MNPLLAIRTFLSNTGLGYQQFSDNSVTMMVPTDKLLVYMTIACVGHTLAVLVTLPTIIPSSRHDEFQRAFAEFNEAIDWGTISLNENNVHVLVTMEFTNHLIPEQVQLCFEQAYEITSSHSDNILRQLFAEHSQDKAGQ